MPKSATKLKPFGSFLRLELPPPDDVNTPNEAFGEALDWAEVAE